jgi:predicted ATPase
MLGAGHAHGCRRQREDAAGDPNCRCGERNLRRWRVDGRPGAVPEPALVPQLVAQVFGLRLSPDQPLMENLLNFVHSKLLLLILDNCEHLVESCAQLTQELLSQNPELRILATSREPLAITGEIIYPVSGLSWPSDIEKLEANPRNLMRYDAVRLFVERAQAISPDFNLTPENARSTIETCWWLFLCLDLTYQMVSF